MIQRIQTVYLAVIVLLIFVLFISGIVSIPAGNDTVIKLTVLGVVKSANKSAEIIVQKNYLNLILCIVVQIVSAVTIFLYRRRNLQLALAKALILTVILLIVSIVLSTIKVLDDFSLVFAPAIAMLIPVFLLVFAFLAHRGIKKDDELVKSYDRLR